MPAIDAGLAGLSTLEALTELSLQVWVETLNLSHHQAAHARVPWLASTAYHGVALSCKLLLVTFRVAMQAS